MTFRNKTGLISLILTCTSTVALFVGAYLFDFHPHAVFLAKACYAKAISGGIVSALCAGLYLWGDWRPPEKEYKDKHGY
jgi:hypothetical protein